MVVPEQRLSLLNDKPQLVEKDYVLYWMQASQRVSENPALSFAVYTANRLHKPLVVCFGITGDFPQASGRHYQFMLEGLQDVAKALSDRGIRFFISGEGPVQCATQRAKDAAVVITDCAYGVTERSWRKVVAEHIDCSLIQVESNVVVPVTTASSKEEYSAATLRRKIEPMIVHFVQSIPLYDVTIKSEDIDLGKSELTLLSLRKTMDAVGVSHEAAVCTWITGGEIAANKRLNEFVDTRLEGYEQHHNDPADPYVSYLSPYLHFGQISPVTIYHAVVKQAYPSIPAFVEQLIVRRELAMNFVYFNLLYHHYEGRPEWARDSLENHSIDRRPIRYSEDELLSAKTHDPYWNAAQNELVHLGTMHGYMRMYWGKKILEWSASPKIAFEIALDFNNRFQLDGRDPNGYAGVAWCFGKHDRPWVERPIFGNIRYMNDKGLERKFAIKKYVERIEKAITV